MNSYVDFTSILLAYCHAVVFFFKSYFFKYYFWWRLWNGTRRTLSIRWESRYGLERYDFEWNQHSQKVILSPSRILFSRYFESSWEERSFNIFPVGLWFVHEIALYFIPFVLIPFWWQSILVVNVRVSILILIQMKMRSTSDPIMHWARMTALHRLKLHMDAYLSPGRIITKATAWQFYYSTGTPPLLAQSKRVRLLLNTRDEYSLQPFVVNTDAGRCKHPTKAYDNRLM